MHIIELNNRPDIDQHKKLNNVYIQFGKLIDELRKEDIPMETIGFINKQIEPINSIPESNKELKNQIKKSQSSILKLIEKELKLVTKNHYRNTWLVVGMAAFGLPLGVVFGISIGNMAFLGIGIPIGMAFGIALGTYLDKKASEDGKQLDLEIKF